MRPATFAATAQCIRSCDCSTGSSATFISVAQAPTDEIRTATCVCSLNGMTRPSTTIAATATAEIPARSGTERRITASVSSGLAEMSRSTVVARPRSERTIGRKRKLVAAT